MRHHLFISLIVLFQLSGYGQTNEGNDIVVIPFSAPLMPVIRTPGLSCYKMVISEGSELHINPGIILTVTGL
jgi:hypothetical protein